MKIIFQLNINLNKALEPKKFQGFFYFMLGFIKKHSYINNMKDKEVNKKTCENNFHKILENKFGISWCVRCGRLIK